MFLEYALLSSMLIAVAVSAFTPAVLPKGWAGAHFGDDYLIRDFLFKLPYF